jgi:Flp pilus assembly protein TadD
MVTSPQRIRARQLERQAEGYLELGLPEQAVATLLRLRQGGPWSGHALYLYGEALRSLERYGEAITPLCQAAHLAPGNIHIWVALGWCYKRTGRMDLAIDALRQACNTEPDEALVHYNLACYLSLAGKKEESLARLAQALSLDPHYRALIDEEPDFDPIRSDPGFQALVGVRV